jgi:predicted lysophospholipase L1 biosynthesis ABC-type transport system permease subunit
VRGWREDVGDVAVREEAGTVAAAAVRVVVERLAVLVVEQEVDGGAAEVLKQPPVRRVPARIALRVVGRSGSLDAPAIRSLIGWA